MDESSIKINSCLNENRLIIAVILSYLMGAAAGTSSTEWTLIEVIITVS